MSIIKQLRADSGLTQIELSKKTGVSLRTIQRLDSSVKAPKGHTLKVLAEVFKLTPEALQQKFQAIQSNKTVDALAIKYINLSVLAFLGIPFGNIILPFILWRRKRKSKQVDEAGRKIINVQILWSMLLCIFLCVAPFINFIVASSFPFILLVLCFALLINAIVVITTAMAIQRENFNFLNPPIRFL